MNIEYIYSNKICYRVGHFLILFIETYIYILYMRYIDKMRMFWQSTLCCFKEIKIKKYF